MNFTECKSVLRGGKRCWWALLLVCLPTGCGPDNSLKLVPVSGKITLTNGQPVPRGDIWFVPNLDRGQQHTDYSLSKIGPDGSYTLLTRLQPGAPIGWYKVAVYSTKTEPPANPGGWVPDWIVEAKFASHLTSPLEVEVVPEPQPGRYDFQVSPAP